MKSWFGELTGGVAIMVLASLIGIAQNGLRERPIKLIQKTQAFSTVSHGETPAGETAELPEGAVSLEEAKRLVDGGGAIIIDARSRDAFEKGHIPGALSMPYNEVGQRYDELTDYVAFEDNVVLYCWSPTCDFADQLATEMRIMGFQNLRIFVGGWDHWEEAGYEVETGAGIY